ncbi:MAG: hypothetical protein IKY02_00795 [Lachnospiraceae bacterium]|nr:hypothetical protein [Lachnospiraceae bacterium]
MEERQGKQHQTSGRFYRVLGLLFALLLGLFALLSLVIPDRKVSEQEKRALSSFPVPSFDRLFSGAYGNDFETYLSDQMPFRDAFVRLKVSLDWLTGKNESQGVVRASDGALVELMKEPDLPRVNDTLEAIRSFTEQWAIPTLFALVPNASSVYSETLPKWVGTADQKSFADAVRAGLSGSKAEVLDLSDTLLAAKGSGERLYYRTDHHWTTYGAKTAAEAVLSKLGKPAPGAGTLLAVSRDFSGSLAAKSGYTVTEPDTIHVWVPEAEPLVLVTGSAGKKATLYDTEALSGSDPYTVFLGGNEGFFRVETNAYGTGRLLVFKDSYFNCFLPFLTEAYEQIDVVDPRYYDGEIRDLLLVNEYDQALFLYNMITFSEDRSLAAVLEE